MKNSYSKLATKLGLLFTSLTALSSVSAVELLKLEANKAGMHRITYEQLLAQGADLKGLEVRTIGLSLSGNAVPVLAKGQDSNSGSRSEFGPGGYIEFYASGSESQYSDIQVFALNSLSNDEIAQGQRKLIRTQQNIVDPTAASSSEFLFTKVEHQDNHYSFTSPVVNDPWNFGFTISVRATPTYTFELENVVGGSAAATVEADMFGFVDLDIEGNDHHYEVLINDALAGDQQFDGNALDTFTAESAQVTEGENRFKFNYLPLVDVPFDSLSLNELRISYPRTTDLSGDSIEGYFDANQVQITNTSSIRVYRLFDDGEIRRIIGTRANGAGVQFGTNGEAGNYVVVNEEFDNGGFIQPEVVAIEAEQDITSGTAEYLIIAHPSLMGDELNELVEIRSADYLVKVVDVNQVHAQFNNHNFGYQGIEAYVEHAVANMGTRYVVLVGNDTYDYTGNQYESRSLMPTKYVETKLGGLRVTQTASDASYGDVNDDGIPDVAVGRIGARTKTEVGYVVNKIKAYRLREGYAGRILMATDKDDLGTGINFSSYAEDLIAAMPADWSGALRDDFRAFPEVDGHQEAHDKVIRGINAGVSVVEYIGHSSEFSWAFTTPRMLSVTERPGLTNIGKPAVITQWGCWNTYYVDPEGYTMGERFMLGGEHGAASVMGASSLTTAEGERLLGIELNRRMLNDGVTIGDALIAAKQAVAEKAEHRDIQLAWQILGDPALVINPQYIAT